jgi:hypothetical protein
MEFRLSRTKTCRHPGLTLCEDEGYEACKTRSEKHPNLPPHCGNGNSVPLPLILGESRANRKLPDSLERTCSHLGPEVMTTKRLGTAAASSKKVEFRQD